MNTVARDLDPFNCIPSGDEAPEDSWGEPVWVPDVNPEEAPGSEEEGEGDSSDFIEPFNPPVPPGEYVDDGRADDRPGGSFSPPCHDPRRIGPGAVPGASLLWNMERNKMQSEKKAAGVVKVELAATMAGVPVTLTLELEAAKLGAAIEVLKRQGYEFPPPPLVWQHTAEGTPICPKHRVPMRLREKQGDSWWSHSVDLHGQKTFCRGYEGRLSPGYHGAVVHDHDAGRRPRPPSGPTVAPNATAESLIFPRFGFSIRRLQFRGRDLPS